MRSSYHTMPMFGYDTYDTHWEWVLARRHNIFKPEVEGWTYQHFALDRMRLTQVN
jgi:hypothetical protein